MDLTKLRVDSLILRCINSIAAIGLFLSPAVVVSQTINVNPNLPVYNSSVAIADLDADGYYDVIVVSSSSSIDGMTPSDVGGTQQGSCSMNTPPPANKGGGRLSPLPAGPQLPEGVGLFVHVLDGATNYLTELSPNHDGLNTLWPRQIAGGCTINTNPTVAVGNINFSDSPSVVVGGPSSEEGMYAFQTYGNDVPGFPAYAQIPPFFNAPAIRHGQVRGEWAPPVFPPESTTVDGSAAIIGVDESTYLQRWNGLAVRRQCQWLGDLVYSSPGVSDVGRANAQLADGIPDEIGAADGTYAPPDKVAAFDSLGGSLDCNNGIAPPDLLFNLGDGVYSSSPAMGDLDGDGTQDIAIQHSDPKLQLFASNGGNSLLLEYPLATGSPTIRRYAYSSPVIANLSPDPAGRYDTIVVASDGGRVYAIKYYASAAACAPNPSPCLKPIWESSVLDSGSAISASPLVVKLRNDDGGRPQVIVANDAGNVYILKASDGTVLATFGPLGGTDEGAAIWSTPAVWTRKVDLTRSPCEDDGAQPTNCPIIVVGNRHGTYEIVLTGYPPFNLDPADPATVHVTQWPTFHRSNTRTGALVPAQDGSKDSDPSHTHGRGSVGGVADVSCRLSSASVFEQDGVTPVSDYYTRSDARASFSSDGRFLFELLSARDARHSYKVRFNDNPANDIDASVDPGYMTRADRLNKCASPP